MTRGCLLKTTAENGCYVNLLCMAHARLFSDQFEGLQIDLM